MSTTALKLIALGFMLIDHVGEFFPGMPVFLRWIGRLSAPIFFFCAMWGYHYTHDRRKHLLRLYLCGAAMGIGNALLNALLPAAPVPIINNIFVTILLSCFAVEIIERLRRDRKEGINLLLLFLLLQAASTFLCFWLEGRFFWSAENLAGALLPNLIYNEGGPVWVLLGVLLYFCKENRRSLTVAYSSFCAVLFALALTGGLLISASYKAAGLSLSLCDYLLHYDFQWMMIFSLPFMLAYNGLRGPGLKRFFYIFYPAHIYALFLLSCLIY